MDTTSTNASHHTPLNRISEALGDQGTPEGAAPAPSHDGENGENGENGERQANAQAGRDAKGRFAKGNLGGPGNPHARRVAQYRRAVWHAVTDEDIEAIVRRQVEKAKEGDTAAAKLLLTYTAGKPVPTVDADTLDLQEWEILKNTPVPMEEFEKPLTGMPKSLACDANRIAIPCLRQQYGEVIKLGVFSDDATYAAMCAGANTVAAPDDEREGAKPASDRPPGGRAASGRPATPRPVSRKQKPPSAIGENGASRPATPSADGANGGDDSSRAASPDGEYRRDQSAGTPSGDRANGGHESTQPPDRDNRNPDWPPSRIWPG
jgi:hypothetical protein